MKSRLSVCMCAVALSFSSSVNANQWMPYAPHLTIQGATGSQSQAYGDALFPLWGDLPAFGWLDANAQYGSDRSYYYGMGIGGRGIWGCSSIFGAYAFLDRAFTTRGPDDYWWVLNPGLEYYLPQIDVRFNAYFPQPAGFQYTGPKFKTVPRGADLDIGYLISPYDYFRVHGGVYYYKYRPPGFLAIKGAEAGVSFGVNDYFTVFTDFSYDNHYGTSTIFGLRFEIDAARATNAYGVIEQRMNVPVRRHFGTLYTSAGIPEDGVLR